MNLFNTAIRTAIVFIFLWVANLSPCSAGSLAKQGGPIDIVFCLDLSGSTNGIIVRLRNHFWDYVHELNNCSPRPDIRIGLVGYGRPSFGKENNYVKVIQNLTYDMDGLSNVMFQIPPEIEEGDQVVEAALNVCMKNISWSTDPSALKVIFISGNGMINPGENFDKNMEELSQNGIIVNAVYLENNPVPGEVKGWEDVAKAGKGKFASMQVKFDYYENITGFNLKELQSLNEELNSTYLYYGPLGKERAGIQKLNDENMFKSNTEGYRYRMQFRISDLYLNRNSNWDLVDLHSKDPTSVLTADRETVVDTMKYMSDSAFISLIVFNKFKRNKVVNELRKMIAEREKAVKEKNKGAVKGMKTFDVITISWLRDLLKRNGYECHQ